MSQTENLKTSHPAAFDPSNYTFTVDEFCASHKVSRAKLYQLWQEGQGPRFKKVGKRTLITAEAAAEWRNAPEVAV